MKVGNKLKFILGCFVFGILLGWMADNPPIKEAVSAVKYSLDSSDTITDVNAPSFTGTVQVGKSGTAGYLRLYQTDTAGGTNEGTLYMDDSENLLKYYDGSAWKTVGIDYNLQKYERYDDWLNSGGTTNEYTGEEGTWTQTATGGTARSVTDNAVTRTLASNTVKRDERTGLYWSDYATATVDNEFSWVVGDDAENPTGASCNFLAAGDANAYCDNQDPLTAYTEDNDVSAADLCLNLQLDGDNADSDNNGATGMETDWRLPTQKELQQAYINGAANNLPNPGTNFWSSTEGYSSQSYAWGVGLGYGGTSDFTKVSSYYVRCVRRD